MVVHRNSGPAQFTRPAPSSLRDHAYDEIREAVIAGSLAPGERIKERDVASQMGISTTPVKEALRRLEQEGFVVSTPRRGVMVSSVALTALEEIVQIRAVLESLAAGYASVKMSEESIGLLLGQLQAMKNLTLHGPLDELVEANTVFHEMIREGSDNQFIRRFINSLEPFDSSVRRQALADPTEAERGYREHEAIAAAIAKHQDVRAEALMSEHITRSVRFVVEQSTRRHAMGHRSRGRAIRAVGPTSSPQ